MGGITVLVLMTLEPSNSKGFLNLRNGPPIERNFGGDFGYLVVPWSHAKGYLEEFLLSPNFTTILSGAQPFSQLLSRAMMSRQPFDGHHWPGFVMGLLEPPVVAICNDSVISGKIPNCSNVYYLVLLSSSQPGAVKSRTTAPQT